MKLRLHSKIAYEFTTELWQHAGEGGWHFVSLPLELAQEIRASLKEAEEGWGRLKATAKTGHSTWETAIWFDTKRNTYLLPLKAAIRKKEILSAGRLIDITIWI